MQKAGEVLKGIDLTSKELGQFWQGVCHNSQTMDIFQFKLFCKLCSIKKVNDPFVEASFFKDYPPIEFSRNQESHSIGSAKLAEYKRLTAPAPVSAPAYSNQQQQMGSQIPQQYTSFNQPQIPGPMASSYTPNMQGAGGYDPSQFRTTQPQYGQPTSSPMMNSFANKSPSHTVLLQQNPQQPLSAEAGDSVVIQGADANTISANDLISVRQYVDAIQNDSKSYTFQTLKHRVMGFGIETKEASRIWKLVDLENSKTLPYEAVICLFYLLAVRKKGGNVPPELAAPLGKFIKEKVPPHTDLKIADNALRNVQSTTAVSSVASSQSLIERFRKEQETTETRFRQFKESNKETIDQADKEVTSA